MGDPLKDLDDALAKLDATDEVERTRTSERATLEAEGLQQFKAICDTIIHPASQEFEGKIRAHGHELRFVNNTLSASDANVEIRITTKDRLNKGAVRRDHCPTATFHLKAAAGAVDIHCHFAERGGGSQSGHHKTFPLANLSRDDVLGVLVELLQRYGR